MADAGVGVGDRVLEVGAGLGSLTIALAEAGCRVLAVEFDRRVVPALREVVGDHAGVRVEQIDATRADWRALLGEGSWSMVSNLPYNISVPLVLELLETVPRVHRYLVMVQREVGERLTAGPGAPGYGPVSLRVAYRARTELVRRVPGGVFWPRPSVDSVLVRLDPQPPPVGVGPEVLFRLVEEGFAERRKTMTNALRRLGLELGDASRLLTSAGVPPSTRAEDLGLEAFARVAAVLEQEGAPA